MLSNSVSRMQDANNSQNEESIGQGHLQEESKSLAVQEEVKQVRRYVKTPSLVKVAKIKKHKAFHYLSVCDLSPYKGQSVQ